MPQPTKLIRVVERALDIMELFNTWTPELGLTEIAEASRPHKNTAAGLIHSLAAKGYLAENPANRKYRLAPKVISRAKVVLSSMDLRQTATSHLHRLRDCFSETVNLTIADAGNIGVRRTSALRTHLVQSYSCLLETRRPAGLCGPPRATPPSLHIRSPSRIPCSNTWRPHG